MYNITIRKIRVRFSPAKVLCAVFPVHLEVQEPHGGVDTPVVHPRNKALHGGLEVVFDQGCSFPSQSKAVESKKRRINQPDLLQGYSLPRQTEAAEPKNKGLANQTTRPLFDQGCSFQGQAQAAEPKQRRINQSDYCSARAAHFQANQKQQSRKNEGFTNQTPYQSSTGTVFAIYTKCGWVVKHRNVAMKPTYIKIQGNPTHQKCRKPKKKMAGCFFF